METQTFLNKPVVLKLTKNTNVPAEQACNQLFEFLRVFIYLCYYWAIKNENGRHIFKKFK